MLTMNSTFTPGPEDSPYSVSTYLFCGISFIVTTLAIVAMGQVGIKVWEDPYYVDSLNLPSNADSLGIPIIGAMVATIFLFTLSIGIHAAFLYLCLEKTKKVSLSSFLPGQGNAKILKSIVCFVGVLFFTREFLLFKYINQDVLVWALVFYMATIFSFVCLLIWIDGMFLRRAPDAGVPH